MILLLIGATLTVFVRDSWPVYSFCAAAMLMLAVLAGKRQLDRISLFPLLIPTFGVLQLALSATANVAATRTAILRWFGLAAVLMIAEARLADRQRRDRFLDQFVGFASLTAILCLLQLSSSQGRVLWYFDTGYTDAVFGFFPSRNNFGQFVELALAVALWRALTDQKRRFWFGLASAILYTAAIASTSRGATVLASVELLVVPAAVLWRARKPQFRDTLSLYAGVVGVALALSAASGWDATWKRFQEPDAYEGRREFTRSALRMAAERPLVGQGLGTFPLVYPKYATIDVPEVVRFAHNDWAEFAADGGFLFAAFIFGLFVTAVPRMLHHPWSLGLVFVMVHAGFDYPFPRVAVAGWMFALLGAVRASPVTVRRTWAVPVALVASCAIGMYWCGRLALADVFFRGDTLAAVRRAIELVPDDSRYYLRLAQLDDSDKVEPSLQRALQLNRYDAAAWIDIGLYAEVRGDRKQAEAGLLKAAQIDSTWLPRWTLANYYFRQSGDFWTWAAAAVANAGDRRDLIPLFKLASRMDSDPLKTLQILPDRASQLRQFVRFLLVSGETRGLELAADRLLACGVKSNDRGYVFWAIEGFLSHQRPDGAVHLWAKLADRGWISGVETFRDPPFESSLDWRYKNVVAVVRSLGTDGRLRFEFSGQQAEEAELAERHVPVRPDIKQRLGWDLPAGHGEGIRWEILTLAGTLLAAADVQLGGVDFTPQESVVKIQLMYRRAPGTTRLQGVVDVAPARIRTVSESALLLDHGQR